MAVVGMTGGLGVCWPNHLASSSAQHLDLRCCAQLFLVRLTFADDPADWSTIIYARVQRWPRQEASRAYSRA